MALSINETGKYTSERHEKAKQSGKLTAGEAARLISKITGEKILASDIKSLATEWHHSGFYKKNDRATMGKTYFFTQEQTEKIAADWSKIKVQKQEEMEKIEKTKTQVVFGFYYNWDYDYSGGRGKKRNYKVLHFYSGSEFGKPRNFTELSQPDFDVMKAREGKKYFGWDEPMKDNIL